MPIDSAQITKGDDGDLRVIWCTAWIPAWLGKNGVLRTKLDRGRVGYPLRRPSAEEEEQKGSVMNAFGESGTGCSKLKDSSRTG